MILLDRKKPISALRTVHTMNHTQTNRFCDLHINHLNLIKTIEYTLDKRIYNLKAGLYKININNIEYIINIYFDLNNGDFFIVKNNYDMCIYMAGSNPYPVIPYRINSIKDTESSYEIESVNDSIDIIMLTGKTDYVGTPSLDNPASIIRTLALNINTSNNSESDSLSIPFKHSLGKLPNGVKDYIIINSDKSIAHNIINTSKEVLSGGLDWQYKEEYSDSEYYVFFAKYENVKLNNTADSIRCTHFESVACNELLDESTKKNCIAVSSDTYENGIWIKINKTVLDIHGDKNFGIEMGKWILSQAVNENPIYIEYELSNTDYNTVNINDYNAKTWYPNTIINIDGDYEFSIFYKSLKSL